MNVKKLIIMNEIALFEYTNFEKRGVIRKTATNKINLSLSV